MNGEQLERAKMARVRGAAGGLRCQTSFGWLIVSAGSTKAVSSLVHASTHVRPSDDRAYGGNWMEMVPPRFACPNGPQCIPAVSALSDDRGHHAPVEQRHFAIGMLRIPRIVRHHADRAAILVELAQQ